MLHVVENDEIMENVRPLTFTHRALLSHLSCFTQVQSTGKPLLGGPFTLVDMHGKPVTDKDFHGSFVMLYFGFCHCPDICPSELVKVGMITKKLAETLGAGVVKPVFISVDPDRDSLAQLRHYAKDFHPRFVCVCDL